jgi:hypothetical protein
MTHEELLAKINEMNDSCSVVYIMAKALIALVEMHKPFNSDTDEPRCSRCIDATTENGQPEFISSPYPCETIQAVEKELL